MATEHDIDGDTEWRPPEIPGVPSAAVMLLVATMAFLLRCAARASPICLLAHSCSRARNGVIVQLAAFCAVVTPY